MNPILINVPEKMLQLGLAALAHANRHSAYSPQENEKWPELSILQAAHSAEILLKARISQEHPLLIFDELPKEPGTNTGTLVTLEALFDKGKTVQWSDLPNRLWATTGAAIPNEDIFRAFGKLRNGVQHFGSIPSSVDASSEVLKFVFNVIDPFINEQWGLYAIDYDEDFDSYEYFPPILLEREILFLVSKDAAGCKDYWNIDWETVNGGYLLEMKKRIELALAL
jgi:hypothetical protein